MKPRELIDCHCHLDRYAHPHVVAAQAASRGVFILSVTNLPSHFRAGLPHAGLLKNVRLALGLHPLLANAHIGERELFEQMLENTSYIGEVGLDFSREGKPTAALQLASFRFVAEKVSGQRKILSIHSRSAEREVLSLLTEHRITGSIFHWYSGPLGLIEEIAAAGHYFSVNPSMIASARGKNVVNQIPPDRVLTETDGPYGKARGVPANPWDVETAVDYFSILWRLSRAEVTARINSNFTRLVEQTRDS